MHNHSMHNQRFRASELAAWTFLTNHASVLICLAQNPETRIQDVAEKVRITYPSVQRILDELEEAGYISRGRKKQDARSTQHRVYVKPPLRHPIERHRSVVALLELGVSGGKGH
jgi:DNA-binding MarR family transcriptional regulator